MRWSHYHCHQISPKLSEIDILLLGHSNRKLGFPIQKLSSDSRSEVRFCHFGCFWVGTLRIQAEMGRLASECSEWISANSHQSRHSNGTACFVVCIVICTASLTEKEHTTTLGTMAGQLPPRPIADDTMFAFWILASPLCFLSSLFCCRKKHCTKRKNCI